MLKVLNLEKRYGDRQVLKGLNFSVAPGEIVGLLGLNGAGKSTTMNILTGYISPTAGVVTIDGHDIMKSPVPARRVTGYLPEQLAFYTEMRVDEYLDFACDLKGYSRRRAVRRAHLDEICERVGIAHIRGRMIRNLSKGYRQRVGFAQALIGNPKLLILDEPTVGLDPSQIVEIRRLISDVGRESTVIISSHILYEIQAICQRVLVLHEGRIVADGAPDTLEGLSQTRDRLAIRVRGAESDIRAALEPLGLSVAMLPPREPGACDLRVTGVEGSDIRVAVFFALASASLPLLRTYGDEPTLEDVFLKLVGNERHAEEARL